MPEGMMTVVWEDFQDSKFVPERGVVQGTFRFAEEIRKGLKNYHNRRDEIQE